MNDEVLVRAEGVSKKFCRSLKRSLWYGVQDVTAELLGRKGQHDHLRKNEFWAVDDVSFELRRGECLGLIGPNGAGKSTLLKVLNGLVKPDKGRITMRGRVGALIELGAGFNPILTARENIYVNGSVLGFNKREIDEKFNAIVDFAEILDFVDTPVQNFSSGMRVRLGFAVAAQMEPDVLLIDEVLAVGDAGFRAKCYEAMSIIARSAALIFVSHSMPLVAKLCNQVALMNKGRIISNADPGVSIAQYHNLFPRMVRGLLTTNEHLEILEFELVSAPELLVGQNVQFRIKINSSTEWHHLEVNVVFLDLALSPVCQCSTKNQGMSVNIPSGVTEISLDVQDLRLNPGRYGISLSIERIPERKKLIWLYNECELHVVGDFYGNAPYIANGKWTVQCSP